MCAVTASEDVSDKLTVDDGVEIEEAPVDEVVSSSDSDVTQDEVVSSSDSDVTQDEVVASSEENVLSDDDDKIGIYINTENDIRSGNKADTVVEIYNGYDAPITGKLTILDNGTTVYPERSITIAKEATFKLTAADLKNLPLGDSLLYVTFFDANGVTHYITNPINVVFDFNLYFKDGDKWQLLEEDYDLYGYNDEDTQLKVELSNKLSGVLTYTIEGMADSVTLTNGVAYFSVKTKSLDMGVYALGIKCTTKYGPRERYFDLMMRPYFSAFTRVEVNKEFPIEVILPSMYSGSFRIYYYDIYNDEIGNFIKQANVVNGRGTITMNKLSAGTYHFYLIFEATNGYTYFDDDIEITAGENNPNIKVTVPSEVIVGNTVTLTTTGPIGTYDIYIDGLYKNTVRLSAVKPFTYTVSNLALGTHTINVLYDYEGDFQYNGAFKVNVKPVPQPIKLTLSSVKIKKSKNLVLSATLKQGSAALTGKKVTFKFNGKSYSATTNSAGVAKVTIKKSALKKLKVGKKLTIKATYGTASRSVSAKVSK
jgi:hypothetical protein